MDYNVVIVDYGLGNLRSVAGAVQYNGFQPIISDEPAVITAASHLILSGVGAFGDGIDRLRRRNLVEVLNQAVIHDQVPILGICLGAQLLCSSSTEFGDHQGLGWLDAAVRRIDVDHLGLRVPHVGWNDIRVVQESVLFDGIGEKDLFYFTHSYFMDAKSEQEVLANCDYGISIPSAFQRGNIFATQFHPEKSQKAGLRVLNNFIIHTRRP